MQLLARLTYKICKNFLMNWFPVSKINLSLEIDKFEAKIVIETC